MPRYKVIAVGQFNAMLYSPTGKRRVLHTDKPFPDAKSTKKDSSGNTLIKKGAELVPSWLQRIPDETAKQKAARLEAEQLVQASDKEQLEQQETDQKLVTFAGGDADVTTI